MSNTMKTITFIISLFVFLLFFIVVNFVVPPRLILASPNAAFIKAFIYIAGYIAAMYSQALVKQLYTGTALKGRNVIMSLPVRPHELRDRLIPLVLPVIAVIMPMVGRRAVTEENLVSLIYLALLAIIIEVLFLFNNKTLKVYVTNKGFAIKGIDFRLELSIPFSYTNAVGWYPFERIENFLAYGTKVLLYQTYDMGTIAFECSEEEVRQIKGLLVANHVPERRY